VTKQHPITPPPELVASLRNSAPHGIRDAGVTRELWLINHAYAAGADQELEACCKQVAEWQEHWECKDERLRADRRPKPPSLKEEALALVEQHEEGWRPSPKDWDTIRRALEALPND
jgi:hypothetical protein